MVKRKRSNAEGAVYYSESGKRWEAALVVGWKPSAKNPEVQVPVRRKFTGKTRAVVAAKLDDAKKALSVGLEVPDGRTTIETFCRWWLANALPDEGLAPATVQWYTNVLESYVIPIVGHRTLTGQQALTVENVKAMAGRLARDGMSTRTQLSARTALGKVLRVAVENGRVARNVAWLASPPGDSGRARPLKALTTDEVAELLKMLAGTRWLPIVTVGVTTGLRPGELLALHWSDLKLDRQPQLAVRLSLSHVGGAQLKAPKRKRSERAVPLPPEAVAVVRAWKREQAAERLKLGPLRPDAWGGLVFTSEAGGPVRVDSFRQALAHHIATANAAALDGWQKAGKRGDPPTPLQRVTPHWLRHTYATHLLEAGVPIHHVAELLGDTVAIVEAAYSHVLRPKHEIAAVAAGVLGGSHA